ncbi:MAG: chorismate synthase [Acidobacteria bacterium]|nr:chorismate synthase [Acidobacteriota bacterium]
MKGLEFTTGGESHGPSLSIIVRGIPAGLRLDLDRMNGEMTRRQHGYGRGGRMKIEQDRIEVTAGVRGGETLGSPIAMTVRNRDWENWKAAMDPWAVDEKEAENRRLVSPRPGHADLAGGQKYNRRDLRDVLERASARETAARVAAGAVAKELLYELGVKVSSATLSVGRVGDPNRPVTAKDMSEVDHESPLRAIDRTVEGAMVEEVDRAKLDGNTLGGVVAVVAEGLPVGLGSYVHWDEKLDGRLAQAVMSVHAVKAVSIGDGVTAAGLFGSEVHDPIVHQKSKGFSRPTNRAGGLEGGVTNGKEVVIRGYMKPISTLRRGLASVNLDTREPHRSQWERSDVTAIAACGVVCEAMVALVLASVMREKFGGDSMVEMKRNFEGYRGQLRGW